MGERKSQAVMERVDGRVLIRRGWARADKAWMGACRHKMVDESFNSIDNRSLSNSACAPLMSIGNRFRAELNDLEILLLLCWDYTYQIMLCSHLWALRHQGASTASFPGKPMLPH